jgi:CheY-like chemotaxis protein
MVAVRSLGPATAATKRATETVEARIMILSSPDVLNGSDANSNGSAQAEAQPAPTQSKPGILVVDDEAVVRNFLNVGLQHYGFDVWLAADGQQAIQVYQQHGSKIDLVLLDVRMPGLDGPQTLAALLQLNPQLRCCFMTGQAGGYSQTQLLNFGAYYVFYKPFQLAKMVKVLAQIMGQPPPGPPQAGT